MKVIRMTTNQNKLKNKIKYIIVIIYYIMENLMKAKILELRGNSAEATIKMMQQDGKLKKRLSKKEKEELKKKLWMKWENC